MQIIWLKVRILVFWKPISGAKLLYQTAKTCQVLWKKSVFLCKNVEKWEEIGGNIDSGWGNNDFFWVAEGYSDTEVGIRNSEQLLNNCSITAQKCGRNTQVTRENKEENIKNWYFLVVGPSLGVLSLVSRRSVGVLWQDIREVKEVEILTNSTLIGQIGCQKQHMTSMRCLKNTRNN